MDAVPGVALHPVELDLLCTFAQVQPPFPLEAPSTGTSDVERQVLFGAAAQELRDRELADEDGPLDVAEEFVYLLRNCTGVLDLVLNRESGPLAAAVLTLRDEALLVTQDSTDPHGMTWLWAATLDEAVARLASFIPRAETPVTTPFSLPLRPLQAAFDVMMSRMPENGAGPVPMSQREIEELLNAHGIDDRVARRMVSSLQPVVGNGQLGVAVRDESEDQWRRGGRELRWLDTDRGRYRLANVDGDGDGDAWMSVNPLGNEELYGELRSLAVRIR
ncbi:ESX secretion-associated protein EspG [Actinokineospora auranticolor]|uniref:ESAT-6 protein secretion system EspG family protein n=1 Tax=Actinokineospora auranticolor TaxID=155976 RepID=A0A2S6GXX3_9PSEU|nr:ESX secretion-associated protein EspG [Actinokineospora auranticolor]PPK70092.1 ESAT-6 protein secretion system EspG family protein [Actinokineospora auranticolor]